MEDEKIFVTQEQLDGWGVTDVDAIIAALGEPEFNENDEIGWYINGTDTNPEDGIPDALNSLIGLPVSENVSHGGVWGG